MEKEINEKEIIEKVLKLIIDNPELLKIKGSMPNIPLPTMDKEVFWNVIGTENGWKVEQNMITQHVRILDSNGVRRAWGSASAMEELFQKIIKN